MECYMMVSYFDNDDLVMNQKAFELAIMGVQLYAQTREAARLVMVEKLSRAEAMERAGVEPATLSRALTRIEENLEEIIKNGNLIHKDWLIPKELEPLLDYLEKELLEKHSSQLKNH